MAGALPFSFPARVYWEDTDAGGVVYHARHVAFLERARSEWLRTLGHGQEAMRGGGLVFAVRDMRLDFHAPARLDDLLDVGVGVAAVRGASVVFDQDIRRGGQRLLTARVRVAAIDAAGFRPVAIPAGLARQLQSHVMNAEQDG
jgi:acyl-CoA thioester hydrolase